VLSASRVAALLAGLAIAGAMPACALADGDPASDVLLGTSVFFPYSPPVSNGLEKTLIAETAAGARTHFPIKVALIASPVDLGAVPGLFGKPQEYADFLDQEISFLGGRQLLLVVMPAGYGVAGLPAAANAAVAALKKPAGAASNDLAEAAIAAVPELAAAAGHPIAAVSHLPSSGARNGGGGSGSSIAILVGVVCVAVLAVCAALFLRMRGRGRPAWGRRA
jgi:hypothetical protein